MPSKKKKFEPIRWTLEQAASEFQLNPRTVAKRVKAAGIQPEDDGKFSTASIFEALSDDSRTEMNRARRRKLNADADRAELDLKHRTDEILEAIIDDMKGWVIQVRQTILAADKLTDDEKNDLIETLGKMLDKHTGYPHGKWGGQDSEYEKETVS